ncbi:hypothetical protein GBF38_004092 [Nibea albiflora]|uniref:Uncharacterized protein n=1 Tax=Nibea albiflora TaxID=240163 RepID=A0ACB7FBA2_NIBAL|nr:hypothetical protein GBF38_004092 [Nibea albiflora]
MALKTVLLLVPVHPIAPARWLRLHPRQLGDFKESPAPAVCSAKRSAVPHYHRLDPAAFQHFTTYSISKEDKMAPSVVKDKEGKFVTVVDTPDGMKMCAVEHQNEENGGYITQKPCFLLSSGSSSH